MIGYVPASYVEKASTSKLTNSTRWKIIHFPTTLLSIDVQV
jgi:hypothetical protein